MSRKSRGRRTSSRSTAGSTAIPTFYEFGDAVTYQSNGRVLMSGPLGDVNDPNAKLFAFKYHTAMQAHDPVTKRILPMKMGILFQDGDVDKAIREGAKAVGWELPQGYEFVPTDRWLSINHEVAPHEQALTCDTCHATNATRLDWSTLGYTPKSTRNGKPLCAELSRDGGRGLVQPLLRCAQQARERQADRVLRVPQLLTLSFDNPPQSPIMAPVAGIVQR